MNIWICTEYKIQETKETVNINGLLLKWVRVTGLEPAHRLTLGLNVSAAFVK